MSPGREAARCAGTGGAPLLFLMDASFYHTARLLQGGATRFDMLNLAVRPEKGKALLFFPSFADGTSDPRYVG